MILTREAFARRSVVAVGGGHQPPESALFSLGGSFVVQLGVEVRRVDREQKLPVDSSAAEMIKPSTSATSAAQLKP